MAADYVLLELYVIIYGPGGDRVFETDLSGYTYSTFSNLGHHQLYW